MARANGERGKYVGRGRFAEKGGQQVTPFFESSAHNEKIKHLYGNYNWWSWFRYWYLDTVNQITMLLIDKGYYDYDYEQAKTKVTQLLYEDTVKSEADTSNLLAKFGIGVAKSEELEMEDLQQLAMQDLQQLAMKELKELK
jgi:hypothetical protein